jgi:hypothetical protein
VSEELKEIQAKRELIIEAAKMMRRSNLWTPREIADALAPLPPEPKVVAIGPVSYRRMGPNDWQSRADHLWLPTWARTTYNDDRIRTLASLLPESQERRWTVEEIAAKAAAITELYEEDADPAEYRVRDMAASIRAAFASGGAS